MNFLINNIILYIYIYISNKLVKNVCEKVFQCIYVDYSTKYKINLYIFTINLKFIQIFMFTIA